MFEKIDPKTAWKTFRPTERNWDFRTVAHLHRRAGFGASRKQIEDDLKNSPEQIVDRMLSEKDKVFDSQLKTVGRTILASRQPKNLSAWWLYRMLYSPQQLLEKTTLFWHGHFATSAAKVTEVKLMLAQNEALRDQAFGSFEIMVQGISRDPAMLIYLDSTDNRKTHPNENYSRELMELFCLGVGNYSEKDIQEIARCFTGWQVLRKEFRFNEHQHDNASKSFLGSTGKFGGEDAVKIVLKQKAAAEFIAKKLIHFFVFDEPAASPEIVAPIAKTLRENDFEIKPAIRQILTSNIFFSSHSMGRKIKSPVELALGFLRGTNSAISLYGLADRLEELGQLPFYPPNVKGWNGGRNWINSSTVLGRANLIQQILNSDQTRWKNRNSSGWLSSFETRNPEKIVDRVLETLVAVPVAEKARAELVSFAKSANLQQPAEASQLIHAISLLPEFQLG